MKILSALFLAPLAVLAACSPQSNNPSAAASTEAAVIPDFPATQIPSDAPSGMATTSVSTTADGTATASPSPSASPK